MNPKNDTVNHSEVNKANLFFIFPMVGFFYHNLCHLDRGLKEYGSGSNQVNKRILDMTKARDPQHNHDVGKFF